MAGEDPSVVKAITLPGKSCLLDEKNSFPAGQRGGGHIRVWLAAEERSALREG